MLRTSLILCAAVALVGCSKEPPPRFDEPLTQSELERLDTIEAHNAAPIELEGYRHVFVAGRSTEIKDCARCHQPDKQPYRDPALPAGQDAHWDVAVHHAGDMDCFSCHKQEDPAALVSVIDKSATLETSYLHCGSCHKDQFESWLGGAHGKRLTGWNGVRVIQNCAECHNPHAPARPKVTPVAQPIVTPERAKRH